MAAGAAQAQIDHPPALSPSSSASTAKVASGFFSSFDYKRSKGLQYLPADSATALWIGLRFQFRYDSLGGDSLNSAAALEKELDGEFSTNRGRVKGGGILFFDWLDIYSEFDFTTGTLLDLRATVTLQDWLKLRIGQWKSDYNRERIDSSGKQQFVERSISTYWFTIDRQQGTSAIMHFARGSRADTQIWLEYLSGQGRGGKFSNGDGMILGRVQWNPTGVSLPFSQSDLVRREKLLPSIAISAVTGKSPYTRFSSSGGGNLPGYSKGDYRLRQLLIETAFHYRGMSWQQELHFKRIENRDGGETSNLVGGYAQLGSFINEWLPDWPAPLEIAGRFAMVEPQRGLASDTLVEWTLAANWFFSGHRNKLTADVSWLDYDDPQGNEETTRFRLQWELSL
jgi:hypothetical protein